MKRTTFLWVVISVLLWSNADIAYSQNLDINLLEPINHIDAGTGFNNSMLFITHSATVFEIGGVLGMGFMGWLKDNDKLTQTAITTGATLGVNLILTTAIKYAVNRPRPTAAYPDRIINHGVWLTKHSFPSGHTSSAFAFATSLTLAFPEWYVAVPAYVWASSVAFSRMYFGVHYPSDVLGGIIVGAGSAYLTYRLKNWWDEQQCSSSQMKSSAALAYSGFVE